MSRSSGNGRAGGDGTARLALLGAPTLDGIQLRKALEASGVPGAQVDLYASTQGEALISEYAGEARLIQEPAIDEIVGHEVIFVCETGPIAEAVAAAAGPESLVIDLVEGLPAEAGAVLLHADVNPHAASEHRGFIAVPHPLAILLIDLLQPLENSLGVEEAVAVMIRPAGDFGEQGVEELREQTVGLLSFAEMPVETFGRQLAFNIVPQGKLSCDTPRLDSKLASQVARVLGWASNRMTIRLLTAPLFYGHGIEMRLRLRNGATSDLVRDALSGGRLGAPVAGDPSTPLEVAAEKTTRLVELSEDELGGFWLWAVAGGTRSRAAEQAVRLAKLLGHL